MRVLVVARPQFPVPPDELPGVVEGATQWYERHKGKLEQFGLFPGGGGFGVVDVPDGETLNQMLLEMPFAAFSQHDILPFVPGETGLSQMKEALAARAASV